jgi:hypothetical protein
VICRALTYDERVANFPVFWGRTIEKRTVVFFGTYQLAYRICVSESVREDGEMKMR